MASRLSVKDDLIRVTKQIEDTEIAIEENKKSDNKPFLHPAMAERYRQEISGLIKSLNDKASNGQAREHIRALVEKITLTSKVAQKALVVDLHGDLAGILKLAKEHSPNQRGHKLTDLSETYNQNLKKSVNAFYLVAGAGFEPTTFGL